MRLLSVLHRRALFAEFCEISITFYPVVVTIVESQAQKIGSKSSSMLHGGGSGGVFSDSAKGSCCWAT
jgi:hypothetical protein